MKFLTFLALLSFLACSQSKNNKQDIEQHFFNDYSKQVTSEREISKYLYPSDSLNFSSYGLINTGTLHENDEALFFINYTEGTVQSVDKKDFTLGQKITFKEGRGPSEILGLNNMDVFEDFLIINDRNQNKILFFTQYGDYIRESKVSRIFLNEFAIINAQKIIAKSESANEYLFHVIDNQGNILKSFQRKSFESTHPFAYSGKIKYRNDDLFFVGYSEPMIKKYSLSDNTVEYSIEIINSYNSSANYIKSTGGEFNSFGFAPGATFSAHDFDVSGKYIYVASHNNQMQGYNFLDLYDEETGEYVKSYKTKYQPTNILISTDNILYSVEYDYNKENWWLIKYEDF